MENTEIFVIIMTGKCLVSLIKGPLKKKKEPNKKMHKGHKAPYKRKKYKWPTFGERCCLIRN